MLRSLPSKPCVPFSSSIGALSVSSTALDPDFRYFRHLNRLLIQNTFSTPGIEVRHSCQSQILWCNATLLSLCVSPDQFILQGTMRFDSALNAELRSSRQSNANFHIHNMLTATFPFSMMAKCDPQQYFHHPTCTISISVCS